MSSPASATRTAKAQAPVLRVALYESAGSQPLAGPARAELLKALLEKGYAVTCIRPASGHSRSPAFPGRRTAA